MDYYLSLEPCKQLNAWGCDVDSKYRIVSQIKGINKVYYYTNIPKGLKLYIHETYDIRNIICNGEMAKKFFGENYIERRRNTGGYYASRPEFIQYLLLKNKREKAEKYFLKHTIYNPSNKTLCQ